MSSRGTETARWGEVREGQGVLAGCLIVGRVKMDDFGRVVMVEGITEQVQLTKQGKS